MKKRTILILFAFLCVSLHANSDGTSSGAVAIDYSAVDAYADAAPASATRTVAALAAYLARAGNDETTKARALFRWLTMNIAYDVQAFRTGRYGDLSAEGVLRSRSSVCEGYSALARSIGTQMGLEVVSISGYSKGFSYTAGQSIGGATNHAWNAVRIAGVWRLMDATWGAGYVDYSYVFHRLFQPHYFLTPPEDFIYDHLPEDPQWQLLDDPLSAAEYANLVYLRPGFFAAGLSIGSHPLGTISATDRVSVTLGASAPVEMSIQVLAAATQQDLGAGYGFVQAAAPDVQVEAVFPRAGEYILRLFARPLGATADLEWVLDYRISASRGDASASFPVVYSSFMGTGSWLSEPLAGTLRAGQSQRFRLRVPGAVEVAVVIGTRWTRLTQSGDEWIGEVAVTAGDVNVYALYTRGTNQYTGLLSFRGR